MILKKLKLEFVYRYSFEIYPRSLHHVTYDTPGQTPTIKPNLKTGGNFVSTPTLSLALPKPSPATLERERAMNNGGRKRPPPQPQPQPMPANPPKHHAASQEDDFVDEDVFLDETLVAEDEDSLILRDLEERGALASRLSRWARPALSADYASASGNVGQFSYCVCLAGIGILVRVFSFFFG